MPLFNSLFINLNERMMIYLPRTSRKRSRTKIYHIIIRGINRQTIFEEEEDISLFLQILKKFKEISGYKIFGYCIMGNHIHLLIKEGEEELGIVMRRIGASFVYWYNFKYERSGHLFQDRFKSEVVEDANYLLNVLRYIHQNPVKAGLVKDISDYKWSSYSEYVDSVSIVDSNYILGIFHRNRDIALRLFNEFHQKQSKECPQPPSMAVLLPAAVTGQLTNGHPQHHWHLQWTIWLSKIKTESSRFFLSTLFQENHSSDIMHFSF